MRLLTAFLLFALLACNSNPGKPGTPTVVSETGAKNVRNDISVKSKGITVQQAFLLFEDGKLVPQDNKVEVGQTVRLRLIVEGWKPVDGKVYLGASEKIATDEGQVILNEEDLFAANTEGANPPDANVITLSATITRIDKLFKYFEVGFKVWDKKSEDKAEGSYRLYLK